MTDLAELGFSVDTSQPANAAVVLDKLTTAANRTDTATERLNASFSKSGAVMNQYAAGISAITAAEERNIAAQIQEGMELDRLRAKYNPLFATVRQYKQTKAELAAANRMGAISSAEYTAALSRERQATLASIDAIKGRNAAISDTPVQKGGVGNFQIANLAAQGQDIGVTAAMGMNAGMIGLQQGTQVAAVVSTMEKPLQGIAAAVASILSPVSLLTIAIITLVAAGIQMVNWASVAKTVLYGVARGLEVIAPYAAVAAAGLALIYSPMIIAGLVQVVAYLGVMTAAAARTAASFVIAWAAAASPLTLFIAGLAVVVTAVMVFRDQITKVLGFDIVEYGQKGINAIIGYFVGAWKSIAAIWGNLPAVFGEIFWNIGQEVAKGFENIVRNAASSINDLINLVPEQFRGGIAPIDLGSIKFTGGINPNSGATANAAKIITDTMMEAQKTDYVGGFINTVTTAAGGAADALRGMADGIGTNTEASKKAIKEAERQAEAYRDLTRDARQFIEGQEREAQSLGITAEAASRMKHEQELLNKAANDNITLSAAQRSELSSLAATMAASEENTRRLTEAYNFGKGVFSSFFSDIGKGISEGASLWDTFANAGLNALQSIADKALEMAANGIWDMIFNAAMGAVGGGATGGSYGKGLWGSAIFSAQGNAFGAGTGLGAHRNTIVSTPTAFMFAQGGAPGLGVMGEKPGSPGEAIMPLKRNSAGDLGVIVSNDNTKAAGIVYHDNRQFHITGSKDDGEAIASAIRAYDDRLPDRLEEIADDPRKRVVNG